MQKLCPGWMEAWWPVVASSELQLHRIVLVELGMGPIVLVVVAGKCSQPGRQILEPTG